VQRNNCDRARRHTEMSMLKSGTRMNVICSLSNGMIPGVVWRGGPLALERKLYRVGPNCETWPNSLTEI
jgi:hypothetical protein